MAAQNTDRLESLANAPVITGELKSILGGLREIRNEIDEISKIEGIAKAAKSLSELKKVTDDLNSANQRASSINDRLTQAQNEIARLSAENVKLKTAEAKATTGLADANERASGSTRELYAASVQNEIALKKLSAAKKELEGAYKSGVITEDQYLQNLIEIKEAQTALTVSQSGVSKGLKAIERDAQSAEDSIEKATAQIALLKQARDKLNVNDPKQKQQIEQINKAIDKQNDIIKENVSELEKQKINIGNYGGSAKIIVDAVEKLRVKLDQVTTEFGEQSAEAKRVRAEFETLNALTQNEQFLNIAGKVGDVNAELKFFGKQLNNLEQAGLKNSEVYAKVIERMSELQDQVSDTRAEIRALSSDTRGIDLFMGALTSAVDVFQVGAGAMQLFSGESENVQRAILTMTAIENVANGVRSIANQLTTRGTFLHGAYAAVVGTSTGALKAFRIALAATGIGLAITAIVLLTSKMNLFGGAVKKASLDVASLDASLEELTLVSNRQIKNLQQQNALAVSSLKARGASTEEINAKILEGMEKEKQALADLGNAALDEANKTDLFHGRKIKNADEARKLLIIQRGIQKQFAEDDDEEDKKRTAARVESLQKIVDAFDASAEKQNEIEIKLNEDRADNLEKSKANDEKRKQQIKERADAELQILFNIREIELKQEADFAKEIADDESKTKDERLSALNVFADKSFEIIRMRAELEKQLGNKTKNEILLIEKQKHDELLRLDREIIKQRGELNALPSGVVIELSESELAILNEVDKKMIDSFNQSMKMLEIEAEARTKMQDLKKQYAEEDRQLTKQLYDELTQTIAAFFTAADDRRLESLERDFEEKELAAQREIERINREVTNREEAEKQIGIIEARSAQEKIALEAKKRDIEKKKAQTERLAAAATIIGNTAQGVTSLTIKAAEARAQAAVLRSNPLTAPFSAIADAQAALITAQIPFIIGIGAAQLARLIIPKYAHGTENHPGGLMHVGDAGRAEGIIFPDGTVIKSPARDTIMYGPPGTRVEPDFDKMILRATLTNMPQLPSANVVDATPVIKTMGKNIVMAIKNKTENHFELPSRWKLYLQNGHSFREYLDRNL
jgi:predicted  nucleic acid-binding Zn-ribbon protein